MLLAVFILLKVYFHKEHISNCHKICKQIADQTRVVCHFPLYFSNRLCNNSDKANIHAQTKYATFSIPVALCAESIRIIHLAAQQAPAQRIVSNQLTPPIAHTKIVSIVDHFIRSRIGALFEMTMWFS